ncbi:hypothetical protein F7234_03720 [Pseudomonas putida]|uniref:hypothetical protein n=1 Tax=Pseudomonas putida TaxID=303 RepID=UPI00125FEA0B|nr:hypothetical protein [Pseudomonas putida]KAB5626256.1 hypothetical protein F7234_03720 [Pseudomonas putida]
MSHPKNTTTPSSAQLPTLNKKEFGDPDLQEIRLFVIYEGVDLVEGLRFAADLGGGVNQLAHRLAASINDGEIAYLSEVGALAFLGEVAGTLTRASQYALQKMGEQP